MTTPWRKSSRSQNQGACVEVRLAMSVPQIRDSKMGEAAPVLTVSRNDFVALLDSVI